MEAEKKGFEEWLMNYELSEFTPINSDDLKAAWLASREQAIDECMKVAESLDMGLRIPAYKEDVAKAIHSLKDEVEK